MAASKDRLEAAATAFHLIPSIIGSAVWQRFYAPERFTCLGTTKKGVRCPSRKTQGQHLHTQVLLLKSLDPAEEPAKSCEAIQQFLNDIFCPGHRNLPIAAVAEKVESLAPSRCEDASSSTTFESTTSGCSKKSDDTASDASLSDSTDPVLLPYAPLSLQGRSTSDLIREKLCQPLENSSPGHLYAYITASAPGLCKLGRDVHDPARDETERMHRCGSDITLECATPIPAPGMTRLEQLVFAELHPYRHHEVHCARCKSGHIDWFQTSTQHVKAVMYKWMTFMEAQPYSLSMSNGQWDLGWEFLDEKLLTMLCTPLILGVAHDADAVATAVRVAIAAAKANGATFLGRLEVFPR